MPHGKKTFLTGQEIAFIIANYKTQYIRQMAKALGRDPDTVSRYLRSRGWKAKKQHNSKTRALPPGTIVVFKRNKGTNLYLKVDGKFKLLHHHIWQEMYGDIPPGYTIAFKDKNAMNVDPSNLVIVSRKKWLQLNTINNYPPNIRELIKLASTLKKKINEQSSESKGSAVQTA